MTGTLLPPQSRSANNMASISHKPIIIYTSVCILTISILFPRLYIIQTLIYTPIYISSALFFLVIYILVQAIRSDRQYTSISTDATVRIKYALRQLKFTSQAAWSAAKTRQEWEENPSLFLPIHKNASSQVNNRLDSFLRSIKIHFILPWYNRISPSPAFPHAVEVLILQVLSDVTRKAENVDWPDMMVLKVLPNVSDHFQHFKSIEHLSSTSSGPSPNPALPLPLPRKFHKALTNHLPTSDGVSPSIESHLRETLARVLEQTLPEKHKSELTLTIIREVILGAILLPMFEMLCDPDFWNRQIDERGGRYLYEQKQVDKFLSALSSLPTSTVSAANTPLPTSKSRKDQKFPITPSSKSISSKSSSKQFDNFIRSIAKLRTLGDARRLRADVERELRSAKLALSEELRAGHAGKEGDKKLKRAQKYVERLDRAKIDIDQRISILSGQPGKARPSMERSPMSSMILEAAASESVTLYAILSDPSSLAYWLEHMERRGRSRLVQFWLTIEGFKDPLEASGLESALDSASQPIQQTSAPNDSQTTGEDVAFLYEMYFAAGQTGINASQKHLQVIEETAQSGSTTLSSVEIQKVKHAVFASQKEIYDQMIDEDWPTFKKSELYIKAVTDLQRANISSPSLNNETEISQMSSPLLGSIMPLPRTPLIPQPKTPAESSRSFFDILSPSARPRTNKKKGSNPPAMPPTPTASISITPPVFTRSTTTDSQFGLFKDIRKVSPGNIERQISSLESSNPSTPPAPNRISSHLDFLISGDDKEESREDRIKLFGDDEDIDENDAEYLEAQRIEAIQAALNEIIASDDTNNQEPIQAETDVFTQQQPRSPAASMVLFDNSSKTEDKAPRLASRSAEDLKLTKKSLFTTSAPPSRLPSVAISNIKPNDRPKSLHKLSLSPEKSSKQLFDDELDEQFDGDVEGDDPVGGNDMIQLAAPGDLQLSVEISRLQDKIQELVQQDHLLDTLIRQAELTGNQVELRILSRSQSSVRREQRTAIFQKAQFEQQEEENRLVPGRTTISIPSSIMTPEDGESGKQVVKYTIEVNQTGEDGNTIFGWVVVRRYNEFYELDKSLKDWAAEKGEKSSLMEEFKRKTVEMPGKRLVPNLSASFVESRRAGLERYLQSLLSSSIICDSLILRSFLSRSPVPLQSGSTDAMCSSTASLASLAPHNIVKSLYKTMATSLDDAMLGPSMLDMMYTTLSRQLYDFGGMVGLGGDDLVGLLPSALKGGPYTPQWLKSDPIAGNGNGTSNENEGRIGPIGGESGITTFTGPICDLFIEIFDLKENNWLRRQAIVVILQQFLGSTIERKVRDSFRSAISSDSIEKIIANLEDTLFPGGERRPPSIERTNEEKLETKIRASKKLGMLIPDVAANMIGRGNARRAARRVFGALQDTRLNQHLILSIMDEIVNAMFPPR